MIKDEAKITLKNGNKGQKKVLTKMFEKFCWEKTKRNETNVFQLCCGKREKITLVTLVGRTLFENYVEMVAGLPINEQNK